MPAPMLASPSRQESRFQVIAPIVVIPPDQGEDQWQVQQFPSVLSGASHGIPGPLKGSGESCRRVHPAAAAGVSCRGQ